MKTGRGSRSRADSHRVGVLDVGLQHLERVPERPAHDQEQHSATIQVPTRRRSNPLPETLASRSAQRSLPNPVGSQAAVIRGKAI
jgi:hypothetical protein